MDNLYTHPSVSSGQAIIPGILEKDWTEIEKKINIIRTFSDRIHVDFVDGKLFPNLTFLDPAPFAKYAGELYLEAHLMVEEPINYLERFSIAGFKKFIGHIEKMSSQEEFVAKGELLGEVGLALDLPTPIESIKIPLDDLDFVLLMTIHAGFSGQEFVQSSLAKIKDLRSKTLQQVQGKLPIEVDGGINDQTLVVCKEAGANIFVSTSYISSSEKPSDQYEKLQKILQS